MNLVIAPRTMSISEPLLDNIRATGGSIVEYNPDANQLTRIDVGDAGAWKRGGP